MKYLFLTLFISVLFYYTKSMIPEEKCSPLNCPINQGMCLDNHCECFYSYITYIGNTSHNKGGNNTNSSTVIPIIKFIETPHENIIYCNYERKCKVTAFLLEFLFPFGAGHLYTGKLKLALIKLLTFSIFFLFICGELFYLKCKLNALNKCHMYLTFSIIGDIFFWLCFHICDLFSYAFGIYTDGNGVKLI